MWTEDSIFLGWSFLLSRQMPERSATDLCEFVMRYTSVVIGEDPIPMRGLPLRLLVGR